MSDGFPRLTAADVPCSTAVARPAFSFRVAVALVMLMAGACLLRTSEPLARVAWASVAVLMLAALVPVVFVLREFYVRDVYECEPPGNLVRYFLLGVLSVALVPMYHDAVFTAAPHVFRAGGGWPGQLARYVLVVGLGEELCKYACFRLGTLRDHELDEPYDACVYAAFTGLGFAAFENILYVVHPSDLRGSLAVAVLRTLTAVPAHALFAACWGITFGLVRFQRARPWRVALAVAAAALLHGVYDWTGWFLSHLRRDLVGYLLVLALVAAMTGACIGVMPMLRRLSPHRPRCRAGDA